MNFFEENSIFHEKTAFKGKDDQEEFLRMFRRMKFNDVLNFAETKFQEIRKAYELTSAFNCTFALRPKSSLESDTYRKEGNQFFIAKRFQDAYISYVKALRYAENDYQKSICYGNISAVYFHLKNPQACLKNILMARKLHSSPGNQTFLEKMSARKEACNALASIPVPQSLILSYSEHTNIPGLSATVGLRNPRTRNQHLYAKSSMKLGDVVAITEAFQVGVDEKMVNGLNLNSKSETFIMSAHFCYNCGISSFDVIYTCDTCVSMEFCSEFCKKTYYDDFHKIECNAFNYWVNSYEVEKINALRLTFRFLNAGVNIDQEYSSCFDWTHRGVSLEDKAKSVLGFKDSKLNFDLAFLVTKRAMGLRDALRRKPDYQRIIARLKGDGESVFWNLYGQIFKKMQIGSFYGPAFSYLVTFKSKPVEEYGSFVDWLHGMFNHSCRPNVIVYRPKHINKNFYVLLEDVKAGQELTIAYL